MLNIINVNSIPVFLLILVRVSAFFVTLPLFSYRTIPGHFKIGFSFFLSLIIFYTVDVTVIEIDGTYILLVLKEAMVGLLVGLIAYILLSAIQIAGGFIDFQMGFAIANVVDPQTGAQSPLMGQYFYIIALLFLLSVNGHHLLIDGIYNSYQFISIDAFIPFQNGSIADFVIDTFNKMFLIAFQMAIPIVGCLFLVDVALGIIARTVPQLNVFVVGLPLKILVSFMAIFIFLSLYVSLVNRLFESMFKVMRQLMQLFGGA
ncbi:flagellar biosynthetic protein FliR [Virgibacillus halodenitrificans]|jgi:flagellar biosynthesis protein FliR|uniref:Flagellar biosynthetic protein FliR n=1 Tax=Virgibacillus halodenitrificans TaxID=1482 RepID=A0AAC9IZX2_VIRHA|nr:flagellar biosynthetic protein FliR [Virgibacillus halodenitrificans]APC48617.1 flagellar biosynthetic protein FliR [Virgibacillus halodenitrificans]MBD1224180.1 flagellar type III secretion system protein FliR [Virgibacillus halodenitrificans]MCG1028715.1 flagellar type III secretion system protein FliR [Virgibacillus halodenitrificans]MCJ0931191.1 flagellar type III secretion system protein FliR [Virgibacillus halodenitrificans]MEC2160314.1 flagellar biosynthetic protein FliR [Virgibacill